MTADMKAAMEWANRVLASNFNTETKTLAAAFLEVTTALERANEALSAANHNIEVATQWLADERKAREVLDRQLLTAMEWHQLAVNKRLAAQSERQAAKIIAEKYRQASLNAEQRAADLQRDMQGALEEVPPKYRQAMEAKVADLQARLDRLMLEYCPNEMTPEQVANWQTHQQAAGEQAESASSYADLIIAASNAPTSASTVIPPAPAAGHCPECGLGQNAHMYNCSRSPFASHAADPVQIRPTK